MAGQDEGRKVRPSVIVVAARQERDAILVTVLPITHQPPPRPDWGVEIPQAVKRHLGLDDDRSWIIVAEGNEFTWPGYDLRRAPGTGRYEYGFLPPRLFDRVIKAFNALRERGTSRLAPRG